MMLVKTLLLLFLLGVAWQVVQCLVFGSVVGLAALKSRKAALKSRKAAKADDRGHPDDSGTLMAILLVAVSVFGILASMVASH